MPSVLLIADESFARRERALLNRLEVGLADEGLRVLHAEPGGGDEDPGASLSERYSYDRASPFVSTRVRAERLVESMLERGGVSALPNIIHAWGDGCWWLALEVARSVGAPLVLEVWSMRLVRRLRRWERRGARLGVSPLLWCVPSTRVLRAMDAQGLSSPARLVHWGVYAMEKPRAPRRADAPRAIAVLATDIDVDAIETALEGVAMLDDVSPPPLILLDEVAVRRHPEVWEHARALHILEQVSVVAEMERQRELVLYADVLLQPERCGEIRSMTLDALASGMVVVARRDEASDTLDAETPAVLVDEATPSTWAKALREALDDAARPEPRSGAGISFVREQRKASRQVASLVQIYSGLLNE